MEIWPHKAKWYVSFQKKKKKKIWIEIEHLTLWGKTQEKRRWVYSVRINSNPSTLKVTNPFTSITPIQFHSLILNPQSLIFTGFLVIESFATDDEIQTMTKRMEQLVDEFDPSSTASIFSTKNQVTYLLFIFMLKL